MPGEMLRELRMQALDILLAIEAKRNAALVGDQKHAPAGTVEGCDGLRHARQDVELSPVSDIVAFRSFAVDHPVAVQKDISDRHERR